MNPLFEEKLVHNQITYRYSKGKSHVDGKEIHPYHEILYYMGGDVTFVSEKFREKLSPGTLLLIPKETYHQFCIENQNEYTRMVLIFPDIQGLQELLAANMTDIQIIRNLNIHLSNLLERMCRVLCSDQPTENRGVFLQGAFWMLLGELSFGGLEILRPKPRENNRLISGCIRYIDAHFTEEISAQKLAEEMNVSTSTLFHCFKKELGISLYKYIIEKRLIYAHKRIAQQEKPTKIYMECGYNDYPTFYKAYVKMFGCAPSENL